MVSKQLIVQFRSVYRILVYPKFSLIQSSYRLAGNVACDIRVVYSVREQGMEQPQAACKVTFPLNSSLRKIEMFKR